MEWRYASNLLAEFIVSPETRDADYGELLDLVATHCSRFSLTWHDVFQPSQRRDELGKQLAPHQLEDEPVVKWPSTEMFGRIPEDRQPRLRVYSSNAAALNILKRTRPSLFHWLRPSFPEDPCFYFDNGDCCLVTVSHERGAVVYVPHGADDLLAPCERLVRKGMLSRCS